MITVLLILSFPIIIIDKLQKMKKAWHVIDQSKFHYFLVDIHPHPASAAKIPIEYQYQRYFVKKMQLLPYVAHKQKNVYELREVNMPELLDWLRMMFESSGFWLKISPRVAIDFNNNTSVQRQQYVNFLFGRFLVSDKRRQYLCISNDESTYHINGALFVSIFKVIAGICNLWSYRISLDDLSKVYNTFFRDIPIKFKIYVKEGSIIKFSMVPYKLVAKDLIGVSSGKSPYCEGALVLNGKVFNAMANSSRQLKNYYRVPFRSVPSQAESEDLEKITNYLMNIGLSVSEVKAILQMYSLVMNINTIEFAKGKKDEYQFKLREGSLSKDNIVLLIGEDLTMMLEIQLNTFEKASDYTKQNVALKQQLLMRIIYQEITVKLAQIINEKMCNLEATFDNYQQFIMIEFPPLSRYAQRTAEEYFISLFNEKIKSMALCVPFTKKTFNFKFDSIHKTIKEQFLCDINREILKEMDSSVVWFDNLKKGEFMVRLRKRIIQQMGGQQSKEREGKLEDLLEELQGIENNENYFVNYVIQTTVNERNLPVQSDIMNKLLESVNKKRKGRTEEPVNVDNSEQNQQQGPIDELYEEKMVEQEEDFIDIKIPIFQDRYIYCKLLKELSQKNTEIPFIDRLQGYFQANKGKGKVDKQAQKVCLTVSNYLQLERQRKGHENCITKIKRQFKRARFRHSLFANLQILYGKIKFTKALCKKVYPIQKDVFKKIKKVSACHKMGDVFGKYFLRKSKKGINEIKKRSAIQRMFSLLSKKTTLEQVSKIFIANLKKNLKKQRCKRVVEKVNNVIQRISHRLQDQSMKKLSQQYHIVIKPPPVPSYHSVKIKEEQKKEEEGQSLSIPHTQQNTNKSSSLPPPLPPLPPVQNRVNHSNTLPSPSVTAQTTQSQNNKQNIKRSEPIKQQPIKEQPSKQDQSVNSYTSNSQSNYSSYGQSTNRGLQRSQISRKMSQVELISIKDNPKFTFDIWCQEAVGFAKRKPNEPQSSPVVKQIFSKAGSEKQVIKEPPEELNVDILIKQRVVVSPFFPYLSRHMQAQDEEQLQKIMSHQSTKLKKPLLKDYPQSKYLQTAVETFNCILKIGHDKNSSKSRSQLINMIVKSIRQTYHTEKTNISTVFQGEPAIISDYTWDHNLIKDEIFMQFIKQIMMNEKEGSLLSLAGALEVITRYYYPSPKFIYGFLHFLKSLQSKNIQKLNECFVNTLLFAQVYQKYKGNNVTVLKDEILPKENQSYPRLQPRITIITERELDECLTIRFKLLNEETFEYKVRNETLSFFKRKVLKQINMLAYEQYFGVYYCYQAQSPHSKMNETKKAIDFLNEYPHSPTEHLLYIKLKYYFPFSIKQVNKTRIMYLNSIMEERSLPWKGKDYESIVVLSMIFDEFEEERISNYLVFTNQLQANVDLKPIQDKYTEMVNQRGKKISEIEYFKELKEHGFLGAKAYRMREDNPESAVYKFTKIVLKPLQLCFYQQTTLMSSVGLRRIKGFGMEKGQIHLQIDFQQQTHLAMRNMTLHHIERINEFYTDLTTYICYLIDA